MPTNERPILLVEDDPNDAFFLRYAFEEAGITNLLPVVVDGQQAQDYLAGAGRYADRTQYPFPCLVLLDLKLPSRMGIEVLSWIRERTELHSLLVIVLTSSSQAADVDEAYRLGARSYLVKPLSLDKRVEMARLIKKYWLEINMAPSLGSCADKSG